MSESQRCVKHQFERASGLCGQCGYPYCVDCLIQPFPKRPPICKSCAMALAGVRNRAAVRPAHNAKEIKALMKEQAAEAQAAEAKADARPTRMLRRNRQESSSAPVAFVTDAGVVPPTLADTKPMARTKRLWRAAG